MVYYLEAADNTEVNSTLRAHLILCDVTRSFSVDCTGKQLRPLNCCFHLLPLLARVTVSRCGAPLSQWMSPQEGKARYFLAKGSVRWSNCDFHRNSLHKVRIFDMMVAAKSYLEICCDFHWSHVHLLQGTDIQNTKDWGTHVFSKGFGQRTVRKGHLKQFWCGT